MLLKPARDTIVDLPDYNPPPLQPMHEMADRCAEQDRTGRSLVN